MKDKFLELSSAIDFNKYLPIIPIVDNEKLNKWNIPGLHRDDKPKHREFDISKFKYPNNPVSLIQNIEVEYPYLIPDGYLLDFNTNSLSYIVAREYLYHPHFIIQFCDSYGWLSCLESSNSYYQCATSYGLKHYCESSVRYVINGSFIAAALALNLKVQQNSKRLLCTNPKIGLKNSSVLAARNYGTYVNNKINYIREMRYIFWQHDPRLRTHLY